MKNLFIYLILLIASASIGYAGTCGGVVQCNCGDTLTSSQTMWYDLNCPDDGLVINTSHVTLDCNESMIKGSKTSSWRGKNGIRLDTVEYVVVKNCYVEDFDDGVYLDTASESEILDSTIFDNHEGIELHSSHNCTIRNNIIMDNDWQCALECYYSVDNTIDNNWMVKNGDGIRFQVDCIQNYIGTNRIENASWGISLQGYSDDNFIYGNALKGLTEGIGLDESSYNLFFDNRFWDNGVNADEDENSNNNLWNHTLVGNFWDDFSSNPGYPSVYYISGMGGGVDRKPLLKTICSDGIVDPGEECDDGNIEPRDMCSETCTITFCGDGYLQNPNGAGTGGPANYGREECDDGNNISGDGCSSNCVIESCIVPVDGLIITEDTILCAGTYFLNTTVSIQGGGDITLYCNNTKLVVAGYPGISTTYDPFTNISILNCVLNMSSSNHDGIIIFESDAITVINNTVTDLHSWGLVSNFYDHAYVEGNSFIARASGTAKGIELEQINPQGNSVIRRNLASNFKISGLNLNNINNSIVEYNTVEDNIHHYDCSWCGGMEIGGGDVNNSIGRFNNVSGYPTAFRLYSPTIFWTNNNVLEYKAPLRTNTSVFSGNYWENYSDPSHGCIDLDKDNVCDSPYIFNSILIDPHPYVCADGWKETCYSLACGDTIVSDINLTEDLLDCPLHGLIIGANSVTIDCMGHTIDGTGTGHGIHIEGHNNAVIKNCILTDFTQAGYLDNAHGNTFLDSIIESNAESFELSSSNNNNIMGCNISGGEIEMDMSFNTIISRNNIVSSWIYSGWDNFDTRIEHNYILGTALWFDMAYGHVVNNNSIIYGGIQMTGGEGNTITNNYLNGAGSWSIDLGNCNNNIITGNSFVNDGLRLVESYPNTISGNTVNERELVYLDSASDEVIVDAGQVILHYCDNITVEGLNLSQSDVGVQLYHTTDSRIVNNFLSCPSKENCHNFLHLQYDKMFR